jgi:hypothetical protein
LRIIQVTVEGLPRYRAECYQHRWAANFRLKANAESALRAHDVTGHGAKIVRSVWSESILFSELQFKARIQQQADNERRMR